MKCFTLRAKRELLAAPCLHHPMTYCAPELYPEPQEGFRVEPGQSELLVADGLKVFICPDLLRSCKPCQDEPGKLLIERASMERRSNGSLCLLPEKQGEPDSALVLVDLGRGAFSSVRYEIGNRVFLRARRNSDELFGTEELALVEVPVGRPFSAYRSSRRWYCFGGEVVGERLQIRYDGQRLKCDPAQ